VVSIGLPGSSFVGGGGAGAVGSDTPQPVSNNKSTVSVNFFFIFQAALFVGSPKDKASA
jgi:hypothetical protein